MKTYTKHDELTATANSIIEIIDRKVLGTKDLADKLRFVAWKEAVSSVVEVVDSVCEIARIMHEIPLTVIAAERFCKWHERVGQENEGHPFLNWRLITHPDKATFDDHPWLQTVKRRFDLQHTGFKTSAFPPAAELSSETLPKDASHKGKEKVSDAEVKAMIGDDNGEDELADEDAEMGGDTVRYEPARGQPSMRQVATSGSCQPARRSRMPKPKLVKQEEVDELDEEDDEEEDVDMDRPGVNLVMGYIQRQNHLGQPHFPATIVATSVPTPTCPAFGNKKVYVSNAKNTRSGAHLQLPIGLKRKHPPLPHDRIHPIHEQRKGLAAACALMMKMLTKTTMRTTRRPAWKRNLAPPTQANVLQKAGPSQL
ncbi:hypothetical protein BKA82DRAFT_34872 [Pisolithus tinctorius]|uniref:Uncharacterized protein n=1 Tax=Pisolithus tinctorius Marx 270 TaxID=870435 RepID=A0A0C3NFN3_PISTI|nr:hypothetical protein BKA82DRAFT_34872 [Pisolithus tinctorius]KIN94585.1 hypothetical protein M404DRAFT_34872 [Pisolithus tinctorius Marx 270]